MSIRGSFMGIRNLFMTIRVLFMDIRVRRRQKKNIVLRMCYLENN